MMKTDKEVLELCLSWFKDIMERSEKLTSGNVSHGRAAIRGVAKNYADFVAEHLEERRKHDEEDELLNFLHAEGYESFDSLLKSLQPSDEQIEYLAAAAEESKNAVLDSLYQKLKKLKG